MESRTKAEIVLKVGKGPVPTLFGWNRKGIGGKKWPHGPMA